MTTLMFGSMFLMIMTTRTSASDDSYFHCQLLEAQTMIHAPH